MKKRNVILSLGAFVVAASMAFATNAFSVNNAEAEHPSSSLCVPRSTVENDCDPELTDGIQCTVDFGSEIKAAWIPQTDCATELYRPNN